MLRRERAIGEHDLIAHGVGARADLPRRPRCQGIGVDADSREIPTEARLKKRARRCVERPPRRAQRLMHAAGRLAGSGFRRAGTFGPQLPCVFLLAGRTFAVNRRRCRSDRDSGVGHAHHLVGHPVRLMFERIIDLPDREFRLYDSR